MKWFIKALRHYADFSGRARRREYWMFALFNFILSFAWTILLFIKPVAPNVQDDLFYLTQLSWLAMIALPSMAVTVRRLHDTGRSGWMILVGLIPLVGSIWLFVLMVTAGKPGSNAYGPDPKRSTETFTDRLKLRSAGIALIAAASVSILLALFSYRVSLGYNAAYSLVINGLLLASGILLVNSPDRTRTKKAFIFLLIPASIMFLMGVVQWIQLSDIIGNGGWRRSVDLFLYPLLFLCLALFAAASLSSSGRRYVRSTGLLLIVFACADIAWRAFTVERFWSPNMLWQALDMVRFLIPASYIVLAWTFISRQQQPAVDLSAEDDQPYQADRQVEYRPSSPGTGSGPRPAASGQSLTWKIIGLFISIGLIAGGLSGEMVLRGTQSSTALVVAGVVFLILDIISLATHNRGRKKALEDSELHDGEQVAVQELDSPATIRIVRQSSIVGGIVPYLVYLNDNFVGKIKNGQTIDITTYSSHNTVTVFDNDGNPFRGDFTAELEAGGYCEVHVKAGRFVNNK